MRRLIFLILLLPAVLSFGQKGFNSAGIGVSSTYVKNVDSTSLYATPNQLIDSLAKVVRYSDSTTTFVTPSQLVDSLAAVGGGGVQYSDSTTTFVTPSQLVDSLAAVGGGGGGITYDSTQAVFTGDYWVNGDSIFVFTYTAYSPSVSTGGYLEIDVPIPGFTVGTSFVIESAGGVDYEDPTVQVWQSFEKALLDNALGSSFGADMRIEDGGIYAFFLNNSASAATNVRVTAKIKFIK